MNISKARVEGRDLILSTSDLAEIRRFVYEFKAGEYEIVKAKKRRSLDSNSFCWHLVTEIGNVLHMSKDDVYLDMLKKYGQTGVVKIPNGDVDKFKRQFKYVEEHEKLAPEDKAQYLRFWVGSSHYSNSEMSVFIDGIVDEAKALGIDSATPAEIERMKSEWL